MRFNVSATLRKAKCEQPRNSFHLPGHSTYLILPLLPLLERRTRRQKGSLAIVCSLWISHGLDRSQEHVIVITIVTEIRENKYCFPACFRTSRGAIVLLPVRITHGGRVLLSMDFSSSKHECHRAIAMDTVYQFTDLHYRVYRLWRKHSSLLVRI